jgi:long-chain acyl-CoA synthetase
MRYAGELVNEGWCIVIFPEGKLTDAGEIAPFQPGVAMMASRLGVPVIPVRLEGLDKVLHRTWRMAQPGRVRVKFGAPIRLEGEDYAELAKEVEAAVRAL